MQTYASLKVFEDVDFEGLNKREIQLLTKDFRSRKKTIRKQMSRTKRDIHLYKPDSPPQDRRIARRLSSHLPAESKKDSDAVNLPQKVNRV